MPEFDADDVGCRVDVTLSQDLRYIAYVKFWLNYLTIYKTIRMVSSHVLYR